VEDVWDQSGSTRYGYIDPVDMAWEMFEGAIEPYLDELKKHQELELDEEAKKCCMGILKAIYRFEKECESEFKDWAVDAPAENFTQIFDGWKGSCKNPKHIQEMKAFIKNHCSDWDNIKD